MQKRIIIQFSTLLFLAIALNSCVLESGPMIELSPEIPSLSLDIPTKTAEIMSDLQATIEGEIPDSIIQYGFMYEASDGFRRPKYIAFNGSPDQLFTFPAWTVLPSGEKIFLRAFADLPGKRVVSNYVPITGPVKQRNNSDPVLLVSPVGLNDTIRIHMPGYLALSDELEIKLGQWSLSRPTFHNDTLLTGLRFAIEDGQYPVSITIHNQEIPVGFSIRVVN